MKNRRRLLITFGASAFAVPLACFAQQQNKVWRVGFLWTSTPEPKYLEAFRSGLRDLAYVGGRNIMVEQRSAANVIQRLDGLASELVASGVDVVVTQGTPAARAVAKATSTIPVVIALGDPISGGLITSLGRPGRNITGLTVLGIELNAKRLELLREINPKVSRVAQLFDPATTDPHGTPLVDPARLQTAARSLGLQLQVFQVRGPSDFERAFIAASQAHAEALLVSPSPVLSFYNRALVDLAAKHRLPAIYGNPESVELGGLMSYGPSYTALFRRAATYVDKIFKGAKPGDLPVEQPTKFELIINRKTAKALGLTIPQSLLISADKVIE